MLNLFKNFFFFENLKHAVRNNKIPSFSTILGGSIFLISIFSGGILAANEGASNEIMAFYVITGLAALLLMLFSAKIAFQYAQRSFSWKIFLLAGFGIWWRTFVVQILFIAGLWILHLGPLVSLVLPDSYSSSAPEAILAQIVLNTFIIVIIPLVILRVVEDSFE